VIATQLENNVDVLAVLEDVVEEQNLFMLQTLVDFYFGHQLGKGTVTFCLAFDFLRVSLLTILIAEIFFVYRFSI
jgi:hypothetical protein